MSVYVMRSVFDRSPTTAGARLLLLCLAWHANHDGTEVFGAVDRLARECALSERHVRRLIDQLEAAGAIAVERGRGRGRHHRITVLAGEETGHRVPFVEPKPDSPSGNPPEKADTVSALPEENRTSAPEKPDICDTPPPRARDTSVTSLLLPPAAEALDAVLGAFAARGYTTDARFLGILAKTYPDLNLELEALKLAEWLTEPRNRKRPCSRKFIDNWLKKAEADRRERERLTLQALGPTAPKVSGGAVVNGTYHPPAAFQRNPNPEADLPEWDEERAARSAAEKARVKELLFAHRRHTA